MVLRAGANCAAVILMLSMGLSGSGAPSPIPLWPKGAPGEKAVAAPETNTTTAKDNKPAGRAVVRLGNVTEPSVTFYPAPKERNTRAAVLVFPGGGYRILAWDLEGTEVCDWLNSIGINAILVKYRVPQPKDAIRYKQPFQDAQRAVGYVRSKAGEWDLDPNKIGVLGFSAGGHLLAVLSNSAETRSYSPVDEADRASCRPNFVLLIYPAYLSVEDKGVTLAPEVKPNGTPSTFIVQTEDDAKFIPGTLLYYRALRDAGVPAELHVYSHGGHGYGMRHTSDPVTDWPRLAEVWLKRVTPSLGTE